jgi:hypothetical protein
MNRADDNRNRRIQITHAALTERLDFPSRLAFE